MTKRKISNTSNANNSSAIKHQRIMHEVNELNSFNNQGLTKLHVAGLKNDIEEATRLLKEGANPELGVDISAQYVEVITKKNSRGGILSYIWR